MALPTTLIQAIKYFAKPENCLSYMVARRWPNGRVTCPTCGSEGVYFDKTRQGWICKTKHPKRKFSLKTGTIFEDSPLGLDKWLPAVWLIANCKNGISSYELARSLGVTQKTGWFMLHRIRLAMQAVGGGKLGTDGDVEADETFIGGKARFMHRDKAEALGMQRGTSKYLGKTAVFGLLERNTPRRKSRVVARVVPNIKRYELQMEIRKNVILDGYTTVYTDALPSYDIPAAWGRTDEYMHQVIDHAESYVNGNIHTNGIENFWSLLKRTIKGTYVSVEPFHLFRYLDEQTCRFNERGGKDADRFESTMTRIVGRRVTYRQLTGKDGERETA